MHVTVVFDTNDANDLAYLKQLLGTETDAAPAAPAAATRAPRKATAKATATPPEEDTTAAPATEDDGAQEVSLSDAVKMATEMINSGDSDKVKAALSAVGVAKVSVMKADQVPAFLAALKD